MLTILSADLFARGGRGGGSFGGGRSGGSRSSFSRSSSSRSTKSKSTIKKSSKPRNKEAVKPKSVSKNKMDKKMSKQAAVKNKAAHKKYGNKKAATAAYRKKLTSGNKYTSATAPKTRPKHIPQTTTVGGKTVNVTYNSFGGGGYGYGYMDPTTGVFMALAANQMMVNSAMMSQAGYGQWNANGTPYVAPVVVQRTYDPMGWIWGLIGFVIVIALIAVVVKFD